MSPQTIGHSKSRKLKLDSEVSDAEIKSSITYVAGLVERQGKTYWPIIERLDDELYKRKRRARRLAKILNSD
jgi:hypothetical protein